MVTIPSSSTPPKLALPPLPQAIRFFSPRQKKILIILSIIFLAILVSSGIAFYFWLTSFKKSLVDFSISGPTQTASGDPVIYSISYWNNTNQILQNAVLTVRYPQTAMVLGGKVIQNIDLGNIGIGGGGKQDVSLSFIGPDKSIDKLQATLSYKPQNTTSTFGNEISKEVAINGSALGIDFKAPEAILPNIRGHYVIHYKNNTDKVFNDVSIETTYPSEFNFVSSDKTPSKGDNRWDLGDLNPNEEGDITVFGILHSGENVTFDSVIGVNVSGKFYKFSQSSAQINLTSLPLKLDISVNGETKAIANPSDSLRFKIRYKNSAGVALSDVILKAKLDGLMYDFSTLKTDGFYNGLNNTITWNAANIPNFKSLKSGDSGEVEFDINVKPRYVIRTFRDKNFLLQVLATMETPTVPPYLQIKSLSVTNDLALKVNTKAELKINGYYYDSVIKNSGPLPPKVNQTTTYTVHLEITN